MTEELEFLKTCRIDQDYESLTERYFKPKLFGEGDTAQCLLMHSNRLQIVAISPHHPIIINKKTVVSIDFESGSKISRLDNKVSGRFKKGGQKLKDDSPLCIVKCSDNSEYTFVSGVRGTLIEINEKLIDKPHLLSEKPWSDGYIAIVLPPFSKNKQ